jgi:predicted CxxxxCH...CXXCH cytochrome family protein
MPRPALLRALLIALVALPAACSGEAAPGAAARADDAGAGTSGAGGATTSTGAGGQGRGGHGGATTSEGLGGASTTGSSAGGGGAGQGGSGAGGQGGGSTSSPGCSACHGSAASPAPPVDLDGNDDTTALGVGAHQSHLGASGWHRTVACGDCHAVPSKPIDPAVPTHMDGARDVVFDGLSKTGAFDPLAATCSAVYCHGATLADPKGAPTLHAPQWTKVDGSQKACGAACHALPPGGKHPASDACPTCHGEVVATFTNGAVPSATFSAPDAHVDGVVQVSPLGCSSCHGDPGAGSSAPPRGTHGETDTSERAVGAHAAHLAPSAWHRAGQCSDCHVTPASPEHADGVVDLSFSWIAHADGASPAFDAATTSCAGVYCHGVTLRGPADGGAVLRAPVWTTVDGSYSACGSSCHTNPPGQGHVQSADCPKCHAAVIASYVPGAPPTAVFVAPEKHADGHVDVVALDCTTCHGDPKAQEPAPPTGTRGETDTTQPAVGAHREHLGGGGWHRTGRCDDCHAVPKSPIHASGMVDLTWGGPSTSDGAKPFYSSITHRCDDAYCHGTTLLGPTPGGAVSRTPDWTEVDGTFDACGTTCHTTPPGPPHADSTACATCHAPVVASFEPGSPPKVVWNDPELHVDGKVDVAGTACTLCHGDPATKSPAPPKGTHGEVDTTSRAVGAHAAHLAPSTWHRPVTCPECHVVPAKPLHADGVVSLKFTGAATGSGANPSFDGATASCQDVYCHGAKMFSPKPGDVMRTTPVWTEVDGTYRECGVACHTNPPGYPHPVDTACEACHDAVIAAFEPGDPSASVWADASLHVDGTVNLAPGACTVCHAKRAPAGRAAPARGRVDAKGTGRLEAR